MIRERQSKCRREPFVKNIIFSRRTQWETERPDSEEEKNNKYIGRKAYSTRRIVQMELCGPLTSIHSSVDLREEPIALYEQISVAIVKRALRRVTHTSCMHVSLQQNFCIHPIPLQSFYRYEKRQTYAYVYEYIFSVKVLEIGIYIHRLPVHKRRWDSLFNNYCQDLLRPYENRRFVLLSCVYKYAAVPNE